MTFIQYTAKAKKKAFDILMRGIMIQHLIDQPSIGMVVHNGEDAKGAIV